MTEPLPYLKNLRTQNPFHPSLKILNSLQYQSIRTQPKVAVLEVCDTRISRRRDFADEKELETYLASSFVQNNVSGSEEVRIEGRIFLVQDLTLPTLCVLGEWFEIDPLFFASYLQFDPDRTRNFAEGYHCMRPPATPFPWPVSRSSVFGHKDSGPSCSETSRPRSQQHKNLPQPNHATFVYHEIRTFEGKDGKNVPRKEKYEIITADNVRRLVTTAEVWGQRVVVGLVRRNMSVWWGWRRKGRKRKAKDNAHGDDGGGRVDPTIEHCTNPNNTANSEVNREHTEPGNAHDAGGEVNNDENTVWDTILLFDPPASDEFLIRPWGAAETSWMQVQCRSSPYLDGYMDFAPWPPPHTHKRDNDVIPSRYPSPGHCESPSASHRSSTRLTQSQQLRSAFPLAAPTPPSLVNLVITHLLSTPPNTLTHPQLAAVPALTILVARWTIQLDFLIATVSELEKGLLKFEQMDPYPDQDSIHREANALRGLLSDVNGWRRRSFFYEEQGLWNLDNLGVDLDVKLRTGNRGRQSPHRFQDMDAQHHCFNPSDEENSHEHPWTVIHHSFTQLQPHLHLINTRIQSLLPVVMGAFSLLEARQSIIKEDLTIKLSGVALLYVPLSFTASVLGMSDEFVPGKRLFWVFFVVAVPMIGSLFWWGFWAQVGRARRWVGERVTVSGHHRL